MKRLGLIVAMAGLCIWVAAPALAQTYPNPTASVRVAAGVISGSNWCRDSTVTILFDGDELGTAAVGPEGTFSTDFTPPADAEPGEHTVTVEGLGADCTTLRSVDVTIVLGAGDVAFTGVEGSRLTVGMILIGALTLAGAGLLMVARRRRIAQSV